MNGLALGIVPAPVHLIVSKGAGWLQWECAFLYDRRGAIMQSKHCSKTPQPAILSCAQIRGGCWHSCTTAAAEHQRRTLMLQLSDCRRCVLLTRCEHTSEQCFM